MGLRFWKKGPTIKIKYIITIYIVGSGGPGPLPVFVPDTSEEFYFIFSLNLNVHACFVQH